MKVLITQDYNPLDEGNGVSSATFSIAKKLSDLGLTVIYGSNAIETNMNNEYTSGVLFRKIVDAKDITNLVNSVDAVIPVVNFSSNIKPFSLAIGTICISCNKPFFPWVHTTVTNSLFPEYFGTNLLSTQIANLLISNLFKNEMCKKIICVSKAVSQSIKGIGVYPDKTVVIYNGLDIEKILKNKDLSKKYEFDIISVQRFRIEKGNPFTIGILNILKEKFPNFRAVLVGTGPDVNYAKSLINALNLADNIKFINSLKNGELTRLISQSKLLLSTSLTESFGLAIAESMIVQTPVVAPNIEGPAEILQYGKGGFLFNPTDTLTPANIILEILTGKSKTQVDSKTTASKLFAKKNFDIDIQTKLIADVICDSKYP